MSRPAGSQAPETPGWSKQLLVFDCSFLCFGHPLAAAGEGMWFHLWGRGEPAGCGLGLRTAAGAGTSKKVCTMGGVIAASGVYGCAAAAGFDGNNSGGCQCVWHIL